MQSKNIFFAEGYCWSRYCESQEADATMKDFSALRVCVCVCVCALRVCVCVCVCALRVCVCARARAQLCLTL